MNGKMKSCVKGLMMGCCSRPFPLSAKKEPVAYLYNGVRLPALPEWDKETYPYALIHHEFSNDYYRLCLCDKPLKYTNPYGTTTMVGNDTGTNRIGYQLEPYGWESSDALLNYNIIDVFGRTVGEIVWSNYDIINEIINAVEVP